VSTEESNLGYVLRTIKPALGAREVRKVRGPLPPGRWWPPPSRSTRLLQARRGCPPARPGRPAHAGQVVTIELGDTTLLVVDPDGEVLTTVPRNSTAEISRFKAHEPSTPDDGRR
jgi:hypothetical protein